MVIVLENVIGDPSSNPGRANAFAKACIHLFPLLAMGK